MPAAARASRRLGGSARRSDLPLAARTNTGCPETRSRQAASETPRSPGSLDEQASARAGVNRRVTLGLTRLPRWFAWPAFRSLVRPREHWQSSRIDDKFL